MSNILYIMKYVDFEGREVGVNDKKIGITNDIRSREKGLSGTKAPIRLTCLKAWEIGNRASELESIIHNMLKHLKTVGEWVRDDNHEVLDMVSKLLSSSFFTNDNIVELELDREDKSFLKKEEEVREESAQAANKRREALLLKKAQGATLTISKSKKEIKVKVVKDGFEVDGVIYERAQTAVNQTAPKLGLEHNGMSFWSNGLINGVKAKKFVESL